MFANVPGYVPDAATVLWGCKPGFIRAGGWRVGELGAALKTLRDGLFLFKDINFRPVAASLGT